MLQSLFNSIEDGGQPPTSFSPVTSTKRETPKTFGLLVLLFCHTGAKFHGISGASPKLLNLNQEQPSKNWFFLSNSYKFEVTTTSLIEMLELPKSGHMTTSTINFFTWWNFVGAAMDRKCDVLTFIFKWLCFKKA